MATNWAVVRELASIGEREALLAELAADGRDFCGADYVARNEDEPDADPARKADLFVAALAADADMSPDAHVADRVEYMEDTAGALADAAAAAVGGGAA